ncbi:MAG: hypothetical protein ACOYT8_01055 [Candidatus Dependentiae bacterium]
MKFSKLLKIVMFIGLAVVVAVGIDRLVLLSLRIVQSQLNSQQRSDNISPSCSLYENLTYARIYDVYNQAELIIYKPRDVHGYPVKLPLRYTHNIKTWFDNPNQALQDQGYLIPGTKKYFLTAVKGYDPILLHAFSREVDQFVPCWGYKSTTLSRKHKGQQDLVLSMYGHIIDRHHKKIRGAFTCFFDALTGMCYHRFFQPQYSY